MALPVDVSREDEFERDMAQGLKLSEEQAAADYGGGTSSVATSPDAGPLEPAKLDIIMQNITIGPPALDSALAGPDALPEEVKPPSADGEEELVVPFVTYVATPSKAPSVVGARLRR